MTALKIEGRLLASESDDRTLTYLLLPYGEVGRTSAGRMTASAGSVTIPEDPSTVVLNVEHDRLRPVGKATSIVETERGLEASFRIAHTRAGDDVLEEAREGLRAFASVEVDNIVVRAGRLVAGLLSAAAAVVNPAFPSAAMTASDAGDLPAEDEPTPDDSETSEDDTQADEADTEKEADVADSTTTMAASAPAGGLAAKRTTTATQAVGKRDLFTMLASAHRSGGTKAMTAALSDIVPGDILGIEQPAYVGELWSGKAYQRQIVPLFNHADLTSFEVRGWRWVTKPVVAPYAGNKTAVPSNSVETAPVTIEAERIAGAHDIDRKFRDFNDTEFFAAYYAAMTESYALVSDAQVLADVLAAATVVTRGSVPAGAPAGLVSVVDGALSVLTKTKTLPTFALVAPAVWRDILLTPKDKTLEYLSSGLGLESGDLSGFRLQPDASLAAGQVLVGAKSAVTVHELGGDSPIRVEALDIANGGVDAGVFGYYAVNVHDADGLALVTAA